MNFLTSLLDPSPIIDLPCQSVKKSLTICCWDLFADPGMKVCESSMSISWKGCRCCWCQNKKKPGCWCKLGQRCNMELSKVLTWIWQSSYMNLSKLFSAFLAFAKQNQNEVWLRFQSLLKLLLLTKGVDWVETLNALGPLYLWRYFLLKVSLFENNSRVAKAQEIPLRIASFKL